MAEAFLIATSRSIAQSGNAEKAARTLRDSLRRARDTFVMQKDVVIAPPQEELSGFYSLACSTGTQEHTHIASSNAKNAMALKEEFVALLLATGCFKLGHFVLKSGITSPFYIDLRRLIADPKAMKIAAKAYGVLAASCTFDLIAGIPAAGLPLATVAALELDKPMIWPRMPLKEHGTGNRIEGRYAPNDHVLLLDDLITTGASKREALELLEGNNRLDKKYIRGLDELLEEIGKRKNQNIPYVGGIRYLSQLVDILIGSDLADGHAIVWDAANNRWKNGEVSGTSTINFADSETPTGDVDGANTDFVLAHTPTAGSLKVYLNGMRMSLTEDYTRLPRQ